MQPLQNPPLCSSTWWTCHLYRTPLGWARFAKKNFSLLCEIKRIWIRFTCVSLFHYKISLLFFRLFSLTFASNFSLHFTRSEIQVYFFAFFHFFRYFLHFFAIFRIFFASLRFSNFCFEAKQSEAKFKSIFSFFLLFSLFFAFFHFFHFFSLNFRFASIFSKIFAYFTFVFASDFCCFASKWITWNQAFFLLPIDTKFSLQFQISLL
jgi:hypothetical protein